MYICNKKAVRIVVGLKLIVTIDSIFKYAVGLFIYKFVNGIVPTISDVMHCYVN